AGLVEPVVQERQVRLAVDRLDHFRRNLAGETEIEKANDKLSGDGQVTFLESFLDPAVHNLRLGHIESLQSLFPGDIPPRQPKVRLVIFSYPHDRRTRTKSANEVARQAWSYQSFRRDKFGW